MKYLLLVLAAFAIPLHAAPDTGKIVLGKLIFNDTRLSSPEGQSCQSCHKSDAHHADPGQVVSPGATATLFANRNAPSLSYVRFNPELYRDHEEDHWVGGFFLDGREKTLKDQTSRPFFNPLEMAMGSPEALLKKIRTGAYTAQFEHIYGSTIWTDSNLAMGAVSDALDAYMRGPEFGLFTSRYDAYLRGDVVLTDQEMLGLNVFEDENRGNCAACHPSQPGENGEPPLFTDFTYDNLGTPSNPELPFLEMDDTHNPMGSQYIDRGLAENPHIFDAPEQTGKFKVTTLRNIAETAPYMHNGVFKTLRETIEFYNNRDTDAKWGPPEVAENLNTEELGDLQLSEEEIDSLLAFLETLTDGYSKE